MDKILMVLGSKRLLYCNKLVTEIDYNTVSVLASYMAFPSNLLLVIYNKDFLYFLNMLGKVN